MKIEKNVINIIVGAVSGFISGTIIGMAIERKKKAERTREEIAEEVSRQVNMYIDDFNSVHKSETAPVSSEEKKDDVFETHSYTDLVKDLGYKEKAPTKSATDEELISVVSPADFEEDKVLEEIQLYYYVSDGALVNEEHNPVDIQKTIGKDALGRIGEYESNTVYVFNKKLGSKYIVLEKFEPLYPQGYIE